MLHLNYWCESDEEKQELLRIYAGNERKEEEALREKYNPDTLFRIDCYIKDCLKEREKIYEFKIFR